MIEWDVEEQIDHILGMRELFTHRRMDGILSLPQSYAEMPVYEFYANVSSKTLAEYAAQQD